MLEIADITQIPEEQEIFGEVADKVRRFYDDSMPYHNFPHALEVWAAVLSLDDKDPDNSSSQGRLNLGAAALTHDTEAHKPLDPAEGFQTKVERTIAVTAPLLAECGFALPDAHDVGALIMSNQPDEPCDTPNKVKLRRGDLANVGNSRRVIFLGSTMNVFHEEVITKNAAGEVPVGWTPFLDEKYIDLSKLLEPDLSVGKERPIASRRSLRGARGPFSRTAELNVQLLRTDQKIRAPRAFASYVQHRRKYFAPLVRDLDQVLTYITGQVGA